jgi:hypothetical protein
MARPQSEAARLFRRPEKPHVFGLGPPRRARRQAINAGGNNASEELPVEFRISLEELAVELSFIPAAALPYAHASMLRVRHGAVFQI